MENDQNMRNVKLNSLKVWTKVRIKMFKWTWLKPKEINNFSIGKYLLRDVVVWDADNELYLEVSLNIPLSIEYEI